MAPDFQDDDLPARGRDAFTAIYVDVSIPALHQRSRISLKMRPSTATQVFNALAKMEETLFEELGSEVASVESADFKREFCTMRERAVASLGEWQSFVEDWKTSLLTRLQDVGLELDAARRQEATLKHRLQEKDGCAELRKSSSEAPPFLQRRRRRKYLCEQAIQGQRDQAGKGFLSKLNRRDSKESLTLEAADDPLQEDLEDLLLQVGKRCNTFAAQDFKRSGSKRFSISDTVKAGISSIAMLTRQNSVDVQGILPGQATAAEISEEEDEEEEPREDLFEEAPVPKELRDSSAQACAKDVAVAHVGVQCVLRETCDFSSLMTASRSLREEREARKSVQSVGPLLDKVRIPELPRLPERALPPVVQAQALPCSHPSRQPSPAAMRMAAQAMAGSLQAPPRSGTPRSPMAAEVLAPFPAIAMSQRGISLNGLPPFGPVATASTASTATATAAPAGPVTGSALTRVARSWSSSSVTSLPYREPSVSRIPTRPTAQVVTAAPITVTACQSSSLPSAMPT
eukprot:s4915_g7.t1